MYIYIYIYIPTFHERLAGISTIFTLKHLSNIYSVKQIAIGDTLKASMEFFLLKTSQVSFCLTWIHATIYVPNR